MAIFHSFLWLSNIPLCIYSVYFCIWCEDVVQFDSFAYSYPFSPTPFIKEVVLFPLYILASFDID